jgi:signal transduction histidine kinase
VQVGSNPTGLDGEVVAQAAHDLLNLLNVVRTYSGIVQEQVDDANLKDYLERVQNAAVKAADLAHDLQERASGTSG